MRKVVFRHRKGLADHDVDEQAFEVEDDATEADINEMFMDWAWERVQDDFTWYEKKPVYKCTLPFWAGEGEEEFEVEQGTLWTPMDRPPDEYPIGLRETAPDSSWEVHLFPEHLEKYFELEETE